MLRHERMSAVLELVAQRGTVSVEDVIEVFTVSAATARRDLDELAHQQLVTRTRGGAVAHTVTYDLPLRYKSARQSEEKRRIAEAASRLVEPGAVVGLNGGTTITEVARNLATRDDEDRNGAAPRADAPGSRFTVVTNALNIANELAVRPQLKIVVIGGVLRPQSFELIGPFARHVLAGVTIDVTILGVDAISAEHGAAASHEGEAQINHMMVERSRRVVVAADSSKIGERAFCTICPASQIDLLITDTGAPDAALAQLRDQGVTVALV